jgi:hypothetical protein
MIHTIHKNKPEKANSVKEKIEAQNILENTNESSLFDIEVQNVAEGKLPCYGRTLKESAYDNSLTIVNFIMSLNTEIIPSSNYRRDIIKTLCLLSKFHENDYKFENMSRRDILDFLDCYRKPEAADPLHKSNT